MNVERVVTLVAVVLVIVAALNFGLIGAFDVNAVSYVFGEFSVVTRVIYVLMGIAGLYYLYVYARK